MTQTEYEAAVARIIERTWQIIVEESKRGVANQLNVLGASVSGWLTKDQISARIRQAAKSAEFDQIRAIDR